MTGLFINIFIYSTNTYVMPTTPEAASATPGARKVAVNKTDQVPCSHGGSILVEGDKTANKIINKIHGMSEAGKC